MCINQNTVGVEGEKRVKKWMKEGLKPMLDFSFTHREITGCKGEFTDVF